MRHDVAGTLVDAVDMDTAVASVIDAAEDRRPFIATALAVHGIVEARHDPELRYRLDRFDLVAPDGQPVRWALNRLHGARLAERVYGPDLMFRVCEQAATRSLPVYLYGSTATTVEGLRRRLEDRVTRLRVAGAAPSLFRSTDVHEKQAIAARIRDSGAAIVFCGLGCPKQEIWAYEYREALGVPIVAVGAAFDFHAGTLRQAPPRLQRAGLEWLFRLAVEPGRLWRRYLLGNPVFAVDVARQALHRGRDRDPGIPPAGERRFG